MLRQRFREELDYALEADRLEAFTRTHEGDPTIRTPETTCSKDEGRIAFLDYGCVQVLPERLLDARPGELERFAQQYSRLCFEPLFASPYRITSVHEPAAVRVLLGPRGKLAP